MAQEGSHSLIVDEQSLDRMLTRIAHEIVENNDSIENVCFGWALFGRGEVFGFSSCGKDFEFYRI